MGAPKTKANVLSQKQSFLVMSYMTEHKAEIESWKGSVRDLAEMVSKKTGVDVTYNNVRSLAEACDVKIPISNGNQANYIYANLLNRIDALESRLEKLLTSLGVEK